MEITLALDVRPDAEVELEVAGNTLKGARRGRAEPADQPQCQYLRDVRRLYHRGGQLHAVAPADHQQTLHHRERFVDPVDGLADGRDARHRRRVQGQGVAATPPAGHGRHSAATVRCPWSASSTSASGFRTRTITFDVRVPGSDPETQSRDRQCSLDPRDGRHAVRSTCCCSTASCPRTRRRLVEHRQLGVGGHGTGVRVEHGQQLAFDRPTTTW